jgi:hypothetical protein
MRIHIPSRPAEILMIGLNGSPQNISHVRVRYRTDKSIKILYKQTISNGRLSLRAVIGYG